MIDEPDVAYHNFELTYVNPLDFKGIFNYLKSIKADEIHVVCSKTEMNIYARDHTKMSSTVIAVEGAKMNSYFCKDDRVVFSLNRSRVEKIFSSIDKDFYLIELSVNRNDSDCLEIVLKNSTISKDCCYDVTLSNYEEDHDLYSCSEGVKNSLASVKLSFTLSLKDFKNTITHISNYSEHGFSIEKNGDQPLKLTYTQENELQYAEIYKDAEKISLESTVKSTESFICTLSDINLAKSITTCSAITRIKISCLRGKILFISPTESNITIYTVVQTALV